MTASLRVVVLGHGADSPAAGVVANVLEQGVRPEHVLVFHNRTAPDDPELRMPHADVAVVESDRNLGYTGGMNAALRRRLDPDAELVLLLTHDVGVLSGSLGLLVEAAERHPDHGVLGPWLFDPVRRVPFSYGARMSATGGMWHVLERPADERDGIVPADSIDGSFLLVRADVFRQVGLFDEKLFGYAEESELCLRARRAGWKVGVVTAARAEQVGGEPRRPGAFT